MTTLGDLILDAMRTSKLVTFTKYDIAVVAFRDHPEHFSMKTFPEYPDSNRVWATLYGSTGLIAAGHVVKMADSVGGGNRYRLSETGRQKAAALHTVNGKAVDEDASLPRCKRCNQVDGLTDGVCGDCLRGGSSQGASKR